MRIRVLVAVLGLLTSCSTGVPIRFGAHQASAPIVAISNPGFADGDALAGRRAFIAAQCVDCHRVAEDPQLPRGRRSIAGPLLSELSRYAPSEVATRITSRSTGANEELFERTMKNYAQPLTSRELVDIVAYLRNPKVTGVR